MKKKGVALIIAFILLLSFSACGEVSNTMLSSEPPAKDEYFTGLDSTSNTPLNDVETEKEQSTSSVDQDDGLLSSPYESFSVDDIPSFQGVAYIEINDNNPFFDEYDLTTSSFETYSPLDELGRCGVAYANVGQDIMPEAERGSIGQIKPSGWHTVKYDCVDGKYLYNRCHLIGYQLTGENANEENLITGTRYLNIEGMLPFENMVADYVQETNNHVLYRVTPIFEGENLLANGVLMEGYSVEDQGEDVCFCVYAYNVQPGIIIDYRTGDSSLATEDAFDSGTIAEEVNPPNEETSVNGSVSYILNTNSKKFHYPYCSSVDQMSEENKEEYIGGRDDLISAGYDPCKRCNP